jgi:hypothetical protein
MTSNSDRRKVPIPEFFRSFSLDRLPISVVPNRDHSRIFRLCCVLLFGFSLLWTPTLGAQTEQGETHDAAQPDRQQQQIDLLTQQVRRLEERLRRLESGVPGAPSTPAATHALFEPEAALANGHANGPDLMAAAAVPAPPLTPTPARPQAAAPQKPAFEGGFYDGGFVVAKGDDFSLKVNGFTQSRFTNFNPEGGGVNNNFDLALGRLAFSGNAFDPNFSYYMQYEATTFGNTNGVSMLDWWLGYQMGDAGMFQTGRFILPYSRQFYTHPGELMFSDLSAADYAFNLQRAVGASFGGKTGRVGYHIVTTNSIRALDAGGQQNFGGDMAVQGRLEFDILKPFGYLESSPDNVDEAQFSLGIAAAFNPIDQASGFQNVMPGDETVNVTVDTGYRLGRASLQAAGYYRKNDLISSVVDAHDWGYYGQAGYYVVPQKWELAARVSGVSFDQINNPVVGGSVTEYTVALNRYFKGHHFKVNTDYSYLRLHPFTEPDRGDHRVRLQFQLLM